MTLTARTVPYISICGVSLENVPLILFTKIIYQTRLNIYTFRHIWNVKSLLTVFSQLIFTTKPMFHSQHTLCYP